ncbi:MAG: alcohol dehydrogenase catalytic domain-containing protein [Scandinavium sp.]|uniref:alcohol dehydrogenase catalytic domain-containing protein n=1 Tax=Scandinavium sp. TaxID=2830653 RepID=UPI003F316F49
MESKIAVPDTQQSLFLTGKETLELQTTEVPQPQPGEVLVKIGSVGVCGSDKHFYFEGRCGSEIITEPMIMGHEFGGTIVAVGKGVSNALIGQRVSVDPLVPCGHCAHCLQGNYNICPTQKFFGVPGTYGAMQNYLCVPTRNAHAIGDAVSDHAAAMVETISVALAGVQKGCIGLGSRVLITGGGPVGLFAVQVAKACGATEVVLVEPQDGRRRIAHEFGAETLQSLAENDRQYDVLLECTGVQSVRHDACLSVVSGGRAIIIGVGEPIGGFPMSAVIEREVTIHGVMRYKFTWPAVIAALEAQKLNADILVSRSLPLSRAQEAWTQPVANEIKTMIEVNG